MAITVKGGRVISVAAKRLTNDKHEGLAVNIEVHDVRQKDDVAVVQYEHTTVYTPDFAEMKIIGEAWLDGTKEERKRIEEEWKKTKQLPVEAAEELLTSLTYTASTVGTLLAYSINVRSPINVPRVNLPKKQSAPTQTAG